MVGGLRAAERRVWCVEANGDGAAVVSDCCWRCISTSSVTLTGCTCREGEGERGEGGGSAGCRRYNKGRDQVSDGLDGTKCVASLDGALLQRAVGELWARRCCCYTAVANAAPPPGADSPGEDINFSYIV